MTDYELNIRLAFMVGIFLTAAVFFLLLSFSLRQKTSLLWLSLYCFSHPIKSLFKPYQALVSSDFISAYQQHEVSQLIVLLGGFLLIGFLFWELNVPRKKFWIGLYGVFCIFAYFTLSDRTHSDSIIILGLSLTAFGVYQKKRGAWWLLIGMLGYTTISYLGHADLLGFAYFAGIIFFILCMLLSVGQNIAQEMQKQQQALLRAATLENQLLKTTIQPHFVFNSLAALQELIEQNATKASDFVEKLAQEFQLITKASSQKMISMREEIELCKMHLSIMEYRRNACFDFQVEGIKGDEKVPPGIFHTLVENGITHGYSQKNKGFFRLRKEENAEATHYTLFNDSDVEIEKEIVVGTGIRYIQAALEEYFGDKASLTWKGNEKGWRVCISIKK
ncbi:MAG: histidine kinase [Bacteroidota bacterium]